MSSVASSMLICPAKYAAMLERLRGFDPERAEKLHPADKRRIVRAIEVYELTGKTITEHDRETKLREKRYDAAKIALCFEDRQELPTRSL